MSSLEHTTTSVTVQVITKAGDNPPRNEGDVDFMVKYAEGYSGPRHMPEGLTVISKSAAQIFADRGLGHIVIPEADAKAQDETPAAEAATEGIEEKPEPETGLELVDGGLEMVVIPEADAKDVARNSKSKQSKKK